MGGRQTQPPIPHLTGHAIGNMRRQGGVARGDGFHGNPGLVDTVKEPDAAADKDGSNVDRQLVNISFIQVFRPGTGQCRKIPCSWLNFSQKYFIQAVGKIPGCDIYRGASRQFTAYGE